MLLAEFAHDAFGRLRGPALWLIAVMTPLVSIASVASLLGLPLLVAVASWGWTYAYLLVETGAHGLPAPVLSIERTNPWHEPRPLVPLALLGSVGWLASGASGTDRWLLACAAVTVLPACLALLAVESGMWRAFWPPALIRVAVGLGARYLAVCALAAGYVTALGAIYGHVPRLVATPLTLLALFSFASALGRAIYHRREALGLDAWESPEREVQRATHHDDRAADAVASQIYVLLRVHRDAQAWQEAQAWLATRGPDPAPCRWLRDLALVWGMPRFADRLDGKLLARLMAGRRLGEAVGTVEDSWRRNGQLPRLEVQDVEALCTAALRAGHEATAQRLRREHLPAEQAPN